MTDFDKALLDGEVTMYLLRHAPQYFDSTLCHQGPRSYTKPVLTPERKREFYAAAKTVVLAKRAFNEL